MNKQKFYLISALGKKAENCCFVRLLNKVQNGVVPEKQRGKYQTGKRAHFKDVMKQIEEYIFGLDAPPQKSHYQRER